MLYCIWMELPKCGSVLSCCPIYIYTRGDRGDRLCGNGPEWSLNLCDLNFDFCEGHVGFVCQVANKMFCRRSHNSAGSNYGTHRISLITDHFFLRLCIRKLFSCLTWNIYLLDRWHAIHSNFYVDIKTMKVLIVWWIFKKFNIFMALILCKTAWIVRCRNTIRVRKQLRLLNWWNRQNQLSIWV